MVQDAGRGKAVLDAGADVMPPVENGAFLSVNNPIDKLCAVGDPLIVEWKGARYHTLMRGGKMEVIATNLTGQKPRLTILPETSFLLIDIPRNYPAAGFDFNSTLTVRFLRDGKVYTLRTSLTRVHTHPPLLVLEYPEKVEFHNMRSDERIGLILPARIAEHGGSAHKMGAVLDISPTGFRVGLASADGIKAGREIDLSFTLPDGAVVNHLPAVVRSLSEENGKYLMGTRLLGDDPMMIVFYRQCADYAANVQSAGREAMLGLGKDAAIEFAGKRGQIMVRGWKPGAGGYLLAEKPHGPLPPLALGQDAIVRMEKKGVLYGMAVAYKELLRKTNLCYFAFQDEVIARKLRDDDRVRCLLPVTVRRADKQSAALGSGMIVDLCKGGLRLVTRDPMHVEPGEMLLASFHPGGMGSIDGQRIRLMRVSGHGNWFEYAAQFVEMDDGHAKLLDDYIAFCEAWAI